METMTVAAVNKAGTGFMAVGKEGWFNISKGAEITFAGLTKGMTILVEANDKWVKSYTKVQGVPTSAIAPSALVKTIAPASGGYNNPDTQDRIARGNATNAVLGSSETIKTIAELSGSPAETLKLTKDLVAEYANYIATGVFKTNA